MKQRRGCVNCRKINSTFWVIRLVDAIRRRQGAHIWVSAPSKKRVIRICEAISEMTGRDQTLLDQEIVVAKLNRTLNGWANYFCLGTVVRTTRWCKATASGYVNGCVPSTK